MFTLMSLTANPPLKPRFRELLKMGAFKKGKVLNSHKQKMLYNACQASSRQCNDIP